MKVKAAPPYTPIEWRETWSSLVCLKCGAQIYQGWLPFVDMERHAEYSVADHRCQPTDLMLAKGKEEMKQYRSEHPAMTFEEECKIYNQIIANQNYL